MLTTSSFEGPSFGPRTGTTSARHLERDRPIRDELPDLEHIVLIGDKGEPTDVPGTVDYSSLIDEAGADFEVAATKPDDIALLHFTTQGRSCNGSIVGSCGTTSASPWAPRSRHRPQSPRRSSS